MLPPMYIRCATQSRLTACESSTIPCPLLLLLVYLSFQLITFSGTADRQGPVYHMVWRAQKHSYSGSWDTITQRVHSFTKHILRQLLKHLWSNKSQLNRNNGHKGWKCVCMRVMKIARPDSSEVTEFWIRFTMDAFSYDTSLWCLIKGTKHGNSFVCNICSNIRRNKHSKTCYSFKIPFLYPDPVPLLSLLAAWFLPSLFLYITIFHFSPLIFKPLIS